MIFHSKIGRRELKKFDRFHDLVDARTLLFADPYATHSWIAEPNR